MVSKTRLVLYAVLWYVWFWSWAKFGNSWKRALLPPPKVGEVLNFLHHLNCKQAVPFSFTDDERQYLSDLQRGKRGIRRAGCSFPAVP